MSSHSCVSSAFLGVDSFLQALNSPDIVGHIASFLNQNDKKSLRQVCKAAREALDAQVFSIRISFYDGTSGDNKNNPTKPDKESSKNSHPSLGQTWRGAQDVSIDGCRDGRLLFRLLDGAAQRWPSLKYLWISDCQPVYNPMTCITNPLTAQIWNNLITLDITGCKLDSSSLTELSNHLNAASLRRLDLSENNLSSLAPLLENQWPHLKTFIASDNRGLDLIEAISFVTTSFASIERLDLSGVKIQRQKYSGPSANINTVWPQGLKKLKLRRCGLSDADVKPVLCSLPPGLAHLDLEENEFQTKASISVIASIPFPNLGFLSLSRNTRLFSNALSGMEIAHWSSLELLEASELYIDISGIRGLVKARLPCLRTLVLRNCLMSWGAVDQLAAGNWPCLEKLDLGGKEGIHLRRAGSSLASAVAWNNLKLLVVRPTNLTSMRAKTTDRWAVRCLLARWSNLMVVME